MLVAVEIVGFVGVLRVLRPTAFVGIGAGLKAFAFGLMVAVVSKLLVSYSFALGSIVTIVTVTT